MPAFNLWKNTDTLTDGYVTGLEPSVGFPLQRRLEREAGRVPKLAGGEAVSFQMDVEIVEGEGAVGQVQSEIAGIRNGRLPRVVPVALI